MSIPVQGWQMVPVEPTPEMLTSMREKHWAIRGCQLCEQDYRDIHCAMLAAAPKPPVQEPDYYLVEDENSRALQKQYPKWADGDASVKVIGLYAAPQPSDDVAKDALIAKLTTGLSEAKYRIEQGRVWNGMGWTLTGLHPHNQQQAIDAIDAAMAGVSDE